MNKLIGLLILIVFVSLAYFFVNLSLPKDKAVAVPTPTPKSNPYNPIAPPLSAEKLTALVNEWRVSQGFQPYVKSETLCEIAQKRIKVGKDNHAGFYRDYSNYPSVISENSIWNAFDENDALNGWLHSPVHLENLKKFYKYSCTVTDGRNALQIFSNLENGG